MEGQDDDKKKLIEQLESLDDEFQKEIVAKLGVNKQEPPDPKDPEKEKEPEKEVEKDLVEKDSVEKTLKILKTLGVLPVNKQEGNDTASAPAEDRIEAILDDVTLDGLDEVAKSYEISATGKTKIAKTISCLAGIVKAQHEDIGVIKTGLENFVAKSGLGEQLDLVAKQMDEEEKKKKEEEDNVAVDKTALSIAKALKGMFDSSPAPVNSEFAIPEHPGMSVDKSMSRSEAVKKTISKDFMEKLASTRRTR